MTFLNLFVANLKNLLRNRMALFWFLLFPILFMLIFGAVFSSNQDSHFQVGIVSSPDDPIAQGIQAGLSQVKAFTLVAGSSLSDELAALKKGERSIVIDIPEGTGANAASGAATSLPVYYQKGQEQTGMMLYSIVGQALNEIESHMSNRPRLLVAELKPYESAPFKSIDYLLPGILAMALMQLGFFGSMQLLSLREQKVLKALGATPVPRVYVLGSEVLVRLCLALVQLALIIGIGVAVFGVTIGSDWPAMLGIVALGALTFTSLGFMLTSFARTVDAGNGLVQLVQFPMMFLSGIFFPLTTMPAFLAPVVKAIPLTYLGEALRQAMVGISLTPDYPMLLCVGVLVGWLVVSFVLGVIFWRWE